MKVPQFVPWIGEDEYAAIGDCFARTWITEGPLADSFRDKLLALTGARYGVFAPNGTLALYLALRALGIGPGDDVIVPDFTFIGSATAIEMTGARPVFCDVHAGHCQLDLASAAAVLTPRTRAIMPVHIYGTVCAMDAVMDFARQHRLQVVEDAAQAIGVRYRGVHAGTFGDLGVFSFFADKTVTTAEGGFIVTDNPELYDKLLLLRNQGRKERGSFIHPEIGYNFRLTDLQCAVGLVQLAKLDEIIRRKGELIDRYRQRLGAVPQVSFFEPPAGAEWVPFRTPVFCERAHELMAFLTTREIEPRTFFHPLHRQPAFGYLRRTEGGEGLLDDQRFPQSLVAYQQGVCLPIYPTLSHEQVDYVCRTIGEFYGGG